MQELAFRDVDDLALAAQMDRLPLAPSPGFVTTRIGPYMEMLSVAKNYPDRATSIASYVAPGNLSDLRDALRTKRTSWICPKTKSVGFMRCGNALDTSDRARTEFLANAEGAAVTAGFARGLAQQFIAGIMEMEDNVYEHSGSPQTGMVAFRTLPGEFEFVVRDMGIGPLASLRESDEFALMTDHGKALMAMVTEGVSRKGRGQGGFGFRQVFVGLANLQGDLRFRSGDHALSILGRSPRPDNAISSQQAAVSGLIVTVDCQR